MANKKHRETYTKVYWLFTTFMLLTAPPLGLVLIFAKLTEMIKKRRAGAALPLADTPIGARTAACATLPPVQVTLEDASRKMRRRVGIGLVLFVLSIGLQLLCLRNNINVWTACWCVFVSAYYMSMGLHALFSISRFREYLPAMTARPVMTVSELATVTGLKERQIRQDFANLEFMELLPNAFWDRERDLVFCF